MKAFTVMGSHPGDGMIVGADTPEEAFAKYIVDDSGDPSHYEAALKEAQESINFGRYGIYRAHGQLNMKYEEKILNKF